MKILLLVIIGFSLYLSSNAQVYYTTGSNVYTCRNGVVATLVPNRELNSQELEDIDYALFNSKGTYYYLGIQSSDIVSAPTSYYNCHAYAWHLTEGNSNQFWINRGINDSNLSKYWDSNVGCFVQVASESSADKIYYYTGDHSAVKSSVAGKYESKWGAWYVIRHSPNQVPYSSPSNRRYYGRPFISSSSPSAVCSSGSTFSVSNILSVDSIIWSTGPYLTVYSGQNTNLPIIKATSSGDSWVSVRLVNSYGSITLPQKEVWAGDPDPDDFYIVGLDNYGSSVGSDNSFEVCENNYYTFYLYPVCNLSENHHRYGITDVDFYFDFDYTIVNEGYGWAYVYVNNIDGNSTGLVDVDACNYLDEFLVYDVDEGYCGRQSLILSPNPASAEVSIAIESDNNTDAGLKSASTQPTFDQNEEWELEVYNNMQNLKAKKTKIRGNSTILNTHSWNEGVYTVRAKYKGEVLTGKLVVKK